jgi:hypothetical protein
MSEEFKLSNKVIEEEDDVFLIQVSDVKEFIRLLKEEVLRNGRRALPKIDELAGDLGNE